MNERENYWNYYCMDHLYDYIVVSHLRSCMACVQMLFIGFFVEDCNGNVDCFFNRQMDNFGC